ncbi:uncharacterized protein LOC130443029 [Diorhabda sublineata]|uniref:uncharacterized protein LOC130443029 n=1 Tax=Diorhabda sublineata TaxID=1163346 RepID=UPI0024E0614C|nr:uncharacterized protein LOC130443029 [Diorhabda sublineata]
MMVEAVSEQVNQWLQEDLTTQPSVTLKISDMDSKELTTVIIFVILAIIVITLLFVIAIFIDCRQQKLQNLQSKPKKTLLKLKLPVPVILGRAIREDQHSILDKIEYGEPSTSNGNIA